MTRGQRRQERWRKYQAEKRAQFTGQIEIARIQRTPTTAIVARLLRKDGEPQADLRTFVTRHDREVVTRRGLMLPVAALPELRALVEKLIEAAEAEAPDSRE